MRRAKLVRIFQHPRPEKLDTIQRNSRLDPVLHFLIASGESGPPQAPPKNPIPGFHIFVVALDEINLSPDTHRNLSPDTHRVRKF